MFGIPSRFSRAVPFFHGESLTGDPSKNSCDDWPILMRWMRNLSIRSFYTSCGLEKISLEPHLLGIHIPIDKVFGVWFLGPNTSKIYIGVWMSRDWKSSLAHDGFSPRNLQLVLASQGMLGSPVLLFVVQCDPWNLTAKSLKHFQRYELGFSKEELRTPNSQTASGLIFWQQKKLCIIFCWSKACD